MKIALLLTSLILIFKFSNGQKQTVNQLNSEGFNNSISKNGAYLLDVRTKHEYNNGHIKDAGQLNFYAPNFKKKLLQIPKNKPIYLYCNTGYRSEKAAEILLTNGYTDVHNLEHGIMEWYVKSLPVIKEPDAKPETDNKFDITQYQSLINSDSLVFIDFYAPWCAPCRRMMPMIDSLKVKYHNRINIVKINADASKKLMKKLKIIGVPYFVMYRKGELLYSKNGMLQKQEIEEKFEMLLGKPETALY